MVTCRVILSFGSSFATTAVGHHCLRCFTTLATTAVLLQSKQTLGPLRRSACVFCTSPQHGLRTGTAQPLYLAVSYFKSQVSTLDHQKRNKELVMKWKVLCVNHMISLDDNGQPTGHLIDQLDVIPRGAKRGTEIQSRGNRNIFEFEDIKFKILEQYKDQNCFFSNSYKF